MRHIQLEALARMLRGFSGGAPLVINGAWENLTDEQRKRWMRFAYRAWTSVEWVQECPAHGKTCHDARCDVRDKSEQACIHCFKKASDCTCRDRVLLT